MGGTLLNQPYFKTTHFLTLAAVALAVSACSPSADKLKKVIEDNPDVVFVAIEKHPDKFLQVVNKAARDARDVEEKRRAEEETKARDTEFANPKQAEVDPKRAIKGDPAAPVLIVEYTDMECPFCKRGYDTMKRIEQEYPGKVRFLLKHLPLDFHPKARPAAEYYEAIALQDVQKAFKFHSEVFTNQDKLKSQGEKFLEVAAKNVGVDMKRLKADVKGEEVKRRIEADIAEARKYEFQGTPGYLINGVSLRGAYPFEEFKTIIDRHLAEKK